MKKYIVKFIKSVVQKMILDGEITLTTIKGKELEYSIHGEEYTVAHETTTIVLGFQDIDNKIDKEMEIQNKAYGVRL